MNTYKLIIIRRRHCPHLWNGNSFQNIYPRQEDVFVRPPLHSCHFFLNYGHSQMWSGKKASATQWVKGRIILVGDILHCHHLKHCHLRSESRIRVRTDQEKQQRWEWKLFWESQN